MRNEGGNIECLGSNITGNHGAESLLKCEAREGWKSGRGAGFECDENGCRTFGRVSDIIDWNSNDDIVADGYEIGDFSDGWRHSCKLYTDSVICSVRDGGVLRIYTLNSWGIYKIETYN